MNLRRVMRSEDLPLPTSSRGGAVPRIRTLALASTLSEPTIRQVEMGKRTVLVARLPDGTVAAFAPFCPHQGTSLKAASVFEGNLRCPQHNYVYDLRTGQNLLPSRDARPDAMWKLKPGYLPVHRVEERDGWVWVADEPEPPPPGYDPKLEAAPPGRHLRAVPDRAEREPHVPARRPEPELIEHAPSEVTVEPGAEFELTLPTHPVPGHLWRLEGSPDRVRLLGQTFDPADPPACRLTLVAAAQGEVTVRFVYAKPWEPRGREVRTFVVRIRGD